MPECEIRAESVIYLLTREDASGFCTKTTNIAEAAFGKFNQSTKDSTLFSIGDGGSDSSRHNIVEVTDNNVNISSSFFDSINDF